MFDLSWTELLVIGVVALIAIGPKELPGALRALGHWMGKIRRMASDFQSQFNEAMREAEVDELRKQVQELSDKARGYGNFDPLSDVQSEIDSLMDDSPTRDPAARRADAEKDRAKSGDAPIGETGTAALATSAEAGASIEHAGNADTVGRTAEPPRIEAQSEPKAEPKIESKTEPNAGRDA